MAAAKQKTIPGIKVTTKQDGFRRGGQEWFGTTELAIDELTEDQLKQVRDEPKLVVQDIKLSVDVESDDGE